MLNNNVKNKAAKGDVHYSAIDTVLESGLYRTLGQPGTLVNILFDDNYRFQLRHIFSENQIKTRMSSMNVWTDWDTLVKSEVPYIHTGSYVYRGDETADIIIPDNWVTSAHTKIIATCQDSGSAIIAIENVQPGSFKVKLSSVTTIARINYMAFFSDD